MYVYIYIYIHAGVAKRNQNSDCVAGQTVNGSKPGRNKKPFTSARGSDRL